MINKKYIVLGTLITLTTLSVGGYVMTQNNNSDKTNNEITQNASINDMTNSLTTEENKKPEQKEDSNTKKKEKIKDKEETTKNTQK